MPDPTISAVDKSLEVLLQAEKDFISLSQGSGIQSRLSQ
jgi:hypothetical protein